MEGKRNRLKRKPKVSTVSPRGDSSAVPIVGKNNEETGHSDLIVIEEDLLTTVPNTDSKAEVSSTHCAREVKQEDPALESLVKALLAIKTLCTPALPPHSLPDLPHYQPPPQVLKAGNSPQLFTPSGTQSSDLPPLPRLCCCRRQRGSKKRGLQSEQQTQQGPAVSSHTEHRQQPPDPPCPVAAPLTSPQGRAASSRQQAETTSCSRMCTETCNSSRLQAETFSNSQLQSETSSRSRLKAETSSSASHQAEIKSTLPRVQAELSSSSRLHAKAFAYSGLQAETNPGSRLSYPQSQRKIISKTEQGNQTSIETDGSDSHVDCKPTISASSLFSKFSPLSSANDDADEFEENSNRGPLTSASMAEQRRTVRGKALVRKRPSESSHTGGLSKKVKLSAASGDSRGIADTQSLFPSHAQPLFSVLKTNSGRMSQPLISFSTDPSSSMSSKMSTRTNMEQRFLGNASSAAFQGSQQSSFSRNTSISKSQNSEHIKHLGNSSVVTSWNSQQSRFLDGTAEAKDKWVPPRSQPGPSKGDSTKDTTSEVGRSSSAKPLWNVTVRGRNCMGGDTKGPGRGRGAEEGAGKSGGSQQARVKSCPLCQVAFSTAMSLLDIDTHIAACLSLADDDDIVW